MIDGGYRNGLLLRLLPVSLMYSLLSSPHFPSLGSCAISSASLLTPNSIVSLASPHSDPALVRAARCLLDTELSWTATGCRGVGRSAGFSFSLASLQFPAAFVPRLHSSPEASHLTPSPCLERKGERKKEAKQNTRPGADAVAPHFLISFLSPQRKLCPPISFQGCHHPPPPKLPHPDHIHYLRLLLSFWNILCQ